MNFYSYLYFLCFALATYVVYLIFPKKARWNVLLLSGTAFYLFENLQLAVFLFAAAVCTFFTGKVLTSLQERFNTEKKELPKDEKKKLKAYYTKQKKMVVLSAVIVNLGMLLVLKYTGFFTYMLAAFMRPFGFSAEVKPLSFALPLGISYYTLQSIGYIVDTYRGKYKAEKNFAKLALFLSFFPQMTEGPIGRYDHLMPQLTAGKGYSSERFTKAAVLILWGLFKKTVISDRASYMASTVFNDYPRYSGTLIAVAVILYTVQLYTDFSGCIDIMSGTARLFGVELSENFRQPFFSKTVSEFWRRWHISLGTWFKDYVFYPVSLSKPFGALTKICTKSMTKFWASIVPTASALLVVWLGTGLWHGADIKYVVYGLYYFLIMLIGMVTEPLWIKLSDKLKLDRKSGIAEGLRVFRTIILVCFGMALFRVDSVTDFGAIIGKIFAFQDLNDIVNGQLFALGTDWQDFIIIGLGILTLLIVGILKEGKKDVLGAVSTGRIYIKWPVLMALIIAVIILGAYGADYGEVDNIYAQF